MVVPTPNTPPSSADAECVESVYARLQLHSGAFRAMGWRRRTTNHMKMTYRLLLASILGTFCSGMLPDGVAASTTTTAGSDAFVTTGPASNLSNNNYGGGGALAIAAGNLPNGEFQTVIQFGLSGARNSFDTQYGAGQWSIQTVSLQLSSSPHNNPVYNDVAPGLFGISLLQNNSWMEGSGNASNPAGDGITYNTLQNTFINNAADQALGIFSFPGGTSGMNTYSLSLSSVLTADILAGNDLSLRLFAADNTVSYLFSSRSATLASSQPQLVITAVPEPGGLAVFGLGLGMLWWVGRRSNP